jgi:aminopeptidase N
MKPVLFFFLVLSAFYSGQAQNSTTVYEGNRQFVENEKKAYIRNKGDRDLANASTENFDINFYRCEWYIDPSVRAISGKVTSCFTIVSATDKIVFDLSDTLTVDSVVYHGNQLNFQRVAIDGLLLQFPAVLNAGQKDSVAVYYRGVPRSKPAFQSFSAAVHSGVPVIWTSSEPYGAKEWWPCKNGLTDKADSMDIIITSPAAYRATTNGILTSETVAGSNKILFFKHRYPIATYLVALAVTNYVTDIDSVQIGNKSMAVKMNAFPENESDFAYATYTAKQCLPKFSELFGDYPFIKEQYSQTQCGSGGMENQTNTFIGSTWNQLVAHELGHHWFGDHVTCGSWQHIWLNEGFANYMQFIFVQNFNSSLVTAHLQYYLNLITSEPGGSVFVTDTANAARVFDSRLTYAKGGYVVHMLRGILGDSAFFKGLRQYLNDPVVKNRFATTTDLERNLEQVSGKNLQSFFQKWIYGEGYPNYNCTWMQNTNNWVKVQISQTSSNPSVTFYDMPVQLRFRNSSRDTLITVNNRQNGEIFWVNPGFAADTMLIDPDYWILAKERITKKLPAASILENDIKIFPNPASDYINILLLNPKIKTLDMQLYSITGQLVYKKQKDLIGQDELINIPVSQFASGIYLLKVSGANIRETKKIVIR